MLRPLLCPLIFLVALLHSWTRPLAADEATMCRVHAVLEAVCTKCNPRLEAVFKAKGDWCAEHQFPESFCPICKPQQKGRPTMDVTYEPRSRDEAPAHGLVVKLQSPDVARAAGIQTVRTEARTSRPHVEAVVRLVHAATGVASVHARSAGVVSSIEVEVGTAVARGQPLAVIQSAGVGADRSRLIAAQARLKVAVAGRERENSLFQQGVAPKKNVLVAEQEWATAKAEVDAAQSTLQMVAHSGTGGRTTLEAPIAGVVTRRDVAAGQVVDTATSLFEIVDTRSIWALLDVPEADIAKVKVGQPVLIAIDTLPGREFTGRITTLAPTVDRETRTVAARVELSNLDGCLRANMYGLARVLVGSERSALTVPREALQLTKGVHLVFVQKGPDAFETRRVTVGESSAKLSELLSGVGPGEDVVTTGAFLLKTETLKDSIGAGCCAGE